MDRQQLLKRLDTAWQAFHESYVGLSDATLTEPGVTGNWSVKDILAHISIWEEEALTHLPHIIAGGRPPRYSVRYGGIDAFNDLKIAQRRACTLDEVKRQLDATHSQLIDFIQQMSDEHITRETRVRRRLRLDTYSHYPIHTTMIREWREQRNAGNGTVPIDQ